MFLVAGYAYFFSLSLGACPARRVNNFFAGLFHDLPELLTRDIITPVKRSVNQLPSLLRAYELQELERRVFGPLSAGGHDRLVERLRYYLGLVGEGVTSEFDETIRDSSGQVRCLGSFDALHANGNEDGTRSQGWDAAQGLATTLPRSSRRTLPSAPGSPPPTCMRPLPGSGAISAIAPLARCRSGRSLRILIKKKERGREGLSEEPHERDKRTFPTLCKDFH